MSNVALASRTYGEGRIVIVTDRLGSVVGQKGTNSDVFWRGLIEWNAKNQPGDNIRIAVIANERVNYKTKLRSLRPVEFTEVDLQFVSRGLLSDFDLCYFIGLPDTIDSNIKDEIEAFVDDGGGILIENPNVEGNISIIENIDSINVASVQRPNLISGFWTQTGTRSSFYQENAKIKFLTTIPQSTFSTDWSILISDLESNIFDDFTSTITENATSIYSEFGVSNFDQFVDGLILLEEDFSSSSSDESESSASSFSGTESFSSESSSSSSETPPDEVNWSLCENITAYWNLDDNEPNSIIRENQNFFALNGQLLGFGGAIVNTEDFSTAGKFSGAFPFNANGLEPNRIETFPNSLLNFVQDNNDESFSVAFWFYPRSNNPCVLFDKGGDWIISYQDNSCAITLKDESDYYRIRVSNSTISLDEWNFVIMSCTPAQNIDGLRLYINGKDESSAVYAEPSYLKKRNLLSTLVMGNNINLTAPANILLDNVSIYDKALNDFEIEILYDGGAGTPDCEGIHVIKSSSSSSSEMFSDSSSSSSEMLSESTPSSSESEDNVSSNSFSSVSESSVSSGNNESLSSFSSDSSSSSSLNNRCCFIGETFVNLEYNGCYINVGELNGFPVYLNENGIEVAYRLSRGIMRYYMYPQGTTPDIFSGTFFTEETDISTQTLMWREWFDTFVPDNAMIVDQGLVNQGTIAPAIFTGVTTPDAGC